MPSILLPTIFACIELEAHWSITKGCDACRQEIVCSAKLGLIEALEATFGRVSRNFEGRTGGKLKAQRVPLPADWKGLSPKANYI